MKSSEILRKAVELMEKSKDLYPGWGLCHYCQLVEVPSEDEPKVSAIIEKIDRLLDGATSLSRWLLRNNYITIRENYAINYVLNPPWWWKLDSPIFPKDVDAARLKLKNTRITWAKSLAEEFEKEGD